MKAIEKQSNFKNRLGKKQNLKLSSLGSRIYTPISRSKDMLPFTNRFLVEYATKITLKKKFKRTVFLPDEMEVIYGLL